MPRIPLPIKLLLSYLCIVAIGAGPTFVYVRAKLQADLMADTATQLLSHGKRMARVLGSATAPERMAELRLLADAGVDRITFLSPNGDVLFDSEVPDPARLENHLSRPEVRYALGDRSTPRVDFASLLPGSDGIGIAHRLSQTSGLDSLYVALRVQSPQAQLVGVLRVATVVNRIQTMTSGTMHFARNAQALAVSLAIGFSLLAAVVFMRPLQRVSRMVAALAAGDIGAQVGRLANDEVGDVGRALEQMALALRRKLLLAGLGEALLSQLVEALPTPCVVFEEDGTVVALNGAARRSLQIEGQSAGRRMKEFAEQPQVVEALQTAEYEGEPEPIALLLPWAIEARGHLHVLKRPGSAPLRVFIGSELPAAAERRLPQPDEVQPRAIDALVAEAAALAASALQAAGVTLKRSSPPTLALVAEADRQLVSALALALQGGAELLAGRQSELCLAIFEEPLRLRLELDTALPPATVEKLRKPLEPLGGAVEVLSAETRLWLPRA